MIREPGTTAAAPGAAPGKDKAKAKGGGAPKGISWPSPPLPDSPYKFDTGVERNLTLTITKGLNTPFSMVFPDANTILITERGGKLRIVRNGVLSPTPVPGLPASVSPGLPIPVPGESGAVPLSAISFPLGVSAFDVGVGTPPTQPNSTSTATA